MSGDVRSRTPVSPVTRDRIRAPVGRDRLLLTLNCQVRPFSVAGHVSHRQHPLSNALAMLASERIAPPWQDLGPLRP